MIKNEFYSELASAYKRNASIDELKEILGRGRAKKGMFEGDLENGELEIGQVSALIDDILPVKNILENMVSEFNTTAEKMRPIAF